MPESTLLSSTLDERTMRTGPFRKPPPHSLLSLAPLVEHWAALARITSPEGEEARAIKAALDGAPEVARPLDDFSILQKNRALAESIVSAIIPGAARSSVGLARPFALELAFATRSFRSVMLESPTPLRVAEQYRSSVEIMQPIAAHLFTLERLYGVEVPELERAYIVSRANEGTGLDEHFQVTVDLDFVRVRPREQLPAIAPDAITSIAKRFSNPDELFDALPLDAFVFEGFTVFQCADITTQESTNQLRDALVTHDLLDARQLRVVEKRFRSVLRMPGMQMLIGFVEEGSVYFATSGDTSAPLLQRLERCPVDAFDALLAAAAVRASVHVVDDTGAVEVPAALAWMTSSARSLLIAPLMLAGTRVGFLVLGSPARNDFSAVVALEVSTLLPLVARCLRRAHDGVNLQVQAVIKERYTSIHPSVEWRFREVVWNYLRAGRAERSLTEDIVFTDVFPLFGVSDIRSSSITRNRAVLDDLLEQIGLALRVLDAAIAIEPYAMVDRLILELETMRRRFSEGLTSGEEMYVTEFLRREFEPMLPRLETLGERVREAVRAYDASLDPHVGMLYRRRADFDRSLLAVPDCMASLLDRAQRPIQRLFPHYFELHKSDGVDHGMYVGQSLVPKDIVFDEVFLRTLRLWQLDVMCASVRAAEALRGEIPIPLETTHLVLVQHAPLSIRFSISEKMFNVDGAYNARYEIVKKRLDKAEIRGTGERMTQPRKLAIAYAHPREAEEYRQYLRYLAQRGLVGDAVEDLELEELPGVRGLQALRVDVRTDADPSDLATAEFAIDASRAASSIGRLPEGRQTEF